MPIFRNLKLLDALQEYQVDRPFYLDSHSAVQISGDSRGQNSVSKRLMISGLSAGNLVFLSQEAKLYHEKQICGQLHGWIVTIQHSLLESAKQPVILAYNASLNFPQASSEAWL